MADIEHESTEPDWPVGPLLSDRMSVLCLKAEYVGNANPNFMQGIDSLKTRAMRRFDAFAEMATASSGASSSHYASSYCRLEVLGVRIATQHYEVAFRIRSR
ncbi:hypothetical protein F444_05705 [Phytophthora nicotianae P1976]|uniref:Uncharacterized protein n=1 Tax=Phytophthora nicotianae P1976 TaxID=1317066 RepID=A0A081AL73_PHYNI|nr:hypothetical protein F444_05705 [Phytophthora nicotianae P1976]